MMRQSVIGIVFSPDQTKILLIRRRDIPNIWTLPGGGVDSGETPEQAVIREVEEETHLTVEIVRKTGLYTPVNRLTNETHVYACTFRQGKPCTSDETLECAFYNLDTLPKNLFSLHNDFLQDALSHEEVVFKSLDQTSYPRAFWYGIKHPYQMLRFFLARCGMPWNS